MHIFNFVKSSCVREKTLKVLLKKPLVIVYPEAFFLRKCVELHKIFKCHYIFTNIDLRVRP